MTTDIHETAIVGENVTIGKNVKIYPYVFIDGEVEIGNNVTIHPHVVINRHPEHKYMGTFNGGRVFIDDGATIFHHVGITMPTVDETYIGKHAFIMGGARIGHDCKVMEDAIVGGNGMMAGHSVLQKGAFLGDSATIHQWTVVGAYSIIGMNSPVRKNVPPFIKAYGSPVRGYGVNIKGMAHHLFDNEIQYVNQFYHDYKNHFWSDSPYHSFQKFYQSKLSTMALQQNRVKRLFEEFFERIVHNQSYTDTNRGDIVEWYI